MSFILDALRKSEIERQRDAAPTLIRAPLATGRRGSPVLSIVLIVLLSLALAVLATAWWLGERDEPTPPGTPEESALTSTAPVPAAGPATAAIAAPPASSPAGRAGPLPISELERVDPDLPSYRMDMLAFNADPAQRLVWINSRRYQPGQRIEGGPILVEIRPDGAVLEYRGETFLLSP